jgi:hypothetical protein
MAGILAIECTVLAAPAKAVLAARAKSACGAFRGLAPLVTRFRVSWSALADCWSFTSVRMTGFAHE